MKRITLLLSMFVVVAITMNAQFAGGSGIATDPYLIATPTHMLAMHTVEYPAPLYFKMTADVDMQGIEWIPLNLGTYPHKCHFDGNGHVIKNLTVIGSQYSSLFGVLMGSCRNLGVIDADIQSTNGGGIIAGYAGTKQPKVGENGMIINCYTTGKVSGTDAVGGIVGNIGKPFESEHSGVSNCYSTASVTARSATGNSRAGGVVGILYDQGVLENSYATGTVTSSAAGAGGIVGWADSDFKGCVARNDSVINLVAGKIGRIAGNMGAINAVIAVGVNCWGYEGVVVNNAGTILTENDMVTGPVALRDTPFDGLTKSLVFLSDPMSYFSELDWDFASDNNVWAQTMSNGFPIFQWLYSRPDHATIDGLTTSVKGTKNIPIRITLIDSKLSINSEALISSVDVYAITGQKVYSNRSLNSNAVQVQVEKSGIMIVSIIANGKQQVFKVSNK